MLAINLMLNTESTDELHVADQPAMPLSLSHFSPPIYPNAASPSSEDCSFEMSDSGAAVLALQNQTQIEACCAFLHMEGKGARLLFTFNSFL